MTISPWSRDTTDNRSRLAEVQRANARYLSGKMAQASLGEELPCQREPSNRSDHFAVAVLKTRTVVDTGESIDECSPSKKQKEEEAPTQPTGRLEPSTWKWRFGVILTDMDKKIICELNDQIINYAQKMIKNDFPNLLGLQSTLLLAKEQSGIDKNGHYSF